MTIDDVTGVWRVTRDPAPERPPFVLSFTNGHNYARSDFDSGIPNRPDPFSLSGTGDTRLEAEKVSSGSDTRGMTPANGLKIKNKKPSKGRTEKITLVIDGDIIIWTVTH